MASLLFQLQQRWNEQAVEGRVRNIPKSFEINYPGEPVDYRRQRLRKLREKLHGSEYYTDIERMPFGVEVEFMLPSASDEDKRLTAVYSDAMPHDETFKRVFKELRAAGVETEREPFVPRNGVSNVWRLVEDGSIYKGAELVSPVSRLHTINPDLQTACKRLIDMGSTVDNDCGLHVHVDMLEHDVTTVRRLFVLYSRIQSIVDKFVRANRRGKTNESCQPLRGDVDIVEKAASVESVARAFHQLPNRKGYRNNTRYSKLNLTSYWSYGTVEFRHYHGSIDQNEIMAWVTFCLSCVSLAARHEETIRQRYNWFQLRRALRLPVSVSAVFERNMVTYGA